MFLENKTTKLLETYKQHKNLFEKGLKGFTIKTNSRNVTIISKLLGKL